MPRFLLVLFLVLTCTGCDGDDAQQGFEAQAFRTPEGITPTSSGGEIVGEVDEDDWRTAPDYTARIRVTPAYPNPTGTGLVTVELTIGQPGDVRGRLVVCGLSAVGARPSACTRFDLEPPYFGVVSQTLPVGNLLRNEDGLTRLFVYDDYGGGLRLITYGDVRVR